MSSPIETRLEPTRLDSVRPGERFDFLRRMQHGSFINSNLLAKVIEIIPPVKPGDSPDIVRQVTIELLSGRRSRITVGGETLVQNFGPEPARRTSIADQYSRYPLPE